MPTICTKCRYIRQPTDTAPDWQCPACGVAYIKAADAGRAPVQPAARSAQECKPVRQEGGIPWFKLILVAALIWGGWTSIQMAKNRLGGSQIDGAEVGAEMTAADLAALAASVRPGEVVMYSTTECVYCAQAKGWLNQYGFPFEECNMSVRPECETQFKSYRADGTPYLVVRGRHMKNGFDSDEFVALLRN
jgi:glutaredoxin/predicted RNA-binding Zn-ribbon protein involved in translation (DUF1610 family)